jgi:hypothetical protein
MNVSKEFFSLHSGDPGRPFISSIPISGIGSFIECPIKRKAGGAAVYQAAAKTDTSRASPRRHKQDFSTHCRVPSQINGV